MLIIVPLMRLANFSVAGPQWSNTRKNRPVPAVMVR
jgi:hypothetical protein